jgi:hypothetical protein
MIQKVMICGVDCHPGDANCNNYCNHDTSKPMATIGPVPKPEMQLASARRVAHEKLREAERAWYEYFCLCEIGPDREHASDVYENVRTATRVECPPNAYFLKR